MIAMDLTQVLLALSWACLVGVLIIQVYEISKLNDRIARVEVEITKRRLAEVIASMNERNE